MSLLFCYLNNIRCEYSIFFLRERFKSSYEQALTRVGHQAPGRDLEPLLNGNFTQKKTGPPGAGHEDARVTV